jgi:hypothetical protein
MLKIVFPTACTLLATAMPVLAQQPAPPVALSIGVVNSYHFQAADSRLANYYALGSKIKVVLHDKWLLGFSQLTSLAPQNLFATPGLSSGNTQLAEYAVSGGTKWRFASSAYALGDIQVGLGTMRQRGGTAPEWPAGTKATFLTAAAEVGLGYHLTPFLALEAGASYHRYFNGDKLPVATTELNNLSVGLSLVGTFGLTKQR